MLRICATALLLVTFAAAQDKTESKTTPPRVLKTTLPDYTERARSFGISGTVKVDVLVGSDGHVRDVKIIQSVGYGLDEAVVDSVRKWEFRPATKDGSPVEAVAPVECNFRTDSK